MVPGSYTKLIEHIRKQESRLERKKAEAAEAWKDKHSYVAKMLAHDAQQDLMTSVYRRKGEKEEKGNNKNDFESLLADEGDSDDDEPMSNHAKPR